jgi:hypothetical protein
MPRRESRILRECCKISIRSQQILKFKHDVAIVLIMGRLQGKLEILDSQDCSSNCKSSIRVVMGDWYIGEKYHETYLFVICERLDNRH